MTTQTDLGGSFTLSGTSLTVQRMGYGAMQLAGPVYGDRRVILTAQSLFYERPSRPGSTTSIPATFMVRM